MDWVEPLIKLSTMGGFGALLWYTWVRYLPVVEERHRREREQWSTIMAAEIKEIEARHQQEREAWLKHLEKQDAQIDTLFARRSSGNK